MREIVQKLIVLAAVCVLTAIAWADNSAVVGTWDCIATDQAQSRSSWNLVIASNNGSLSGTVTGDEGSYQISNANFDGTNLTFSVSTQSQSYSVQFVVTSGSMSGSYSGSESGTVQGTLE